MSDQERAVRSEIIYEEGWRDLAPEADDAPPVDEAMSQQQTPESRRSIPLLISIQLVVCILAAVVLFVLRAMDSEVYHSFMTSYRVEMNKPVLSRELFEALDIRRLTSADVRVEASPDELPPG